MDQNLAERLRRQVSPKALCQIVLSLFCCLLWGESTHGSQAVARFNAADKELNKTYQAALAVITEPKDRALLVAAQKAWVKYRDENIAFHARYYPDSKGGLFVNTDMTEQRTTELKRLLTPESRESHASGVKMMRGE